MNPYKDKLLAFLDSETSGLRPDEHEILELGLVLYDDSKDEVIKEWSVKIAPRHIHTAQDQALKINGYADDPSLYKANLRTSLIKLNKLVDGCILVGQNIAFDVAFLERALSEFNITPSFDRRKLELMSMAWFCVRNKDLNGLSLKDLCNHFNISNIGAHGALTDCRRALGVYRSIMAEYKNMR